MQSWYRSGTAGTETEYRLPDISTLRRIRQISDLSESRLIEIANRLEVMTARDKALLLSIGSSEKSSLYIIEGRVSLTASDGKTKTVRVDGSQEMMPIAQLRPCVYDVRAIGPVSYLKIDPQILLDFSQMPAAAIDDISVHSLFGDEAEEDYSIINHLYRNLMNNSIRLPRLPSVAERVQSIYRGRDTDIEALVRILVSYPDVSSKLKNVARCARNDKLNSVEKIAYAVNHLGLVAVYSIVMTYAVGILVRRLPLAHFQRVKSFWDHSLTVAAIARLLAKKTRCASPDLAMLAGLVHGIGVLVIDDRLLEHHHLKLDHLEIDHAIQVMRPEISSLLLRKWDFDNELIRVAEECGDWSRKRLEAADLCDLVLVANYYALLHSDTNHTLPRAEAVPAIDKLGVTPQQAIAALRESTEIKRNIKKLFI